MARKQPFQREVVLRQYDPTAPLVFIHLPKTAGTSVNSIVRDWFPDQFHNHYIDETGGRMPSLLSAESLANREAPPLIYGHFNRERGAGIEKCYPDVSQFLSILRDPFDMTVSAIYFWQSVVDPQADLSAIGTKQIANRLRKRAPHTLLHFPAGITMENYREVLSQKFIHIGVTEDLPRSMAQIAARLGKPFDPEDLPRANVTERQRDFPQSMRDEYRDRFPLEHAIYDFAKELVASA